MNSIFNCKYEELTPICRYALALFLRDKYGFTNFSPVFNDPYADGFAAKINSVDELVTPKIETDELKRITKRLYQTVDGLKEPITKVRAYIQLAKKTVDISAKEFGLTLLREKINSKDVEGVRQNLLVVNAYLTKYREPLAAVGLTDELVSLFVAAVAPITEDNQQQFEIRNKRKAIVEQNVKVLNDLYLQLIEILNAGKALFKDSDAAKAKEYTFSRLLKEVRIVRTKNKSEEH